MTHEDFIQQIRELVANRVSGLERKKILATKLVYGIGSGRYRGITYFDGWEHKGKNDFVEIAAMGEESPLQLAGTTIHELAHSLCGPGHGHDGDWRKACSILGLNDVTAEGQDYRPENFDPDLFEEINKLIVLKDGKPNWSDRAGVHKLGLITFTGRKSKGCPMGIGTRGGKGSGPGSGSRLRLWLCGCTPPVRVRVASDAFKARCLACGTSFYVPRKDTAQRRGKK